MFLEVASYKAFIDEEATYFLYEDLNEDFLVETLDISDDIINFLRKYCINYKKPNQLYKYKSEGVLDFYRGNFFLKGHLLFGPNAFELDYEKDGVQTYKFTGEIYEFNHYFSFYLDDDPQQNLVILEFNLIVKK